MKTLIRETCKECEGSGLVYNGIWYEFNRKDEEHKQKTGEHFTEEEMNKYFNERGYTKLPNEECSCAECEGSGYSEYWMNIDELAAIIYRKINKAINH